jgi:hypothetical protein
MSLQAFRKQIPSIHASNKFDQGLQIPTNDPGKQDSSKHFLKLATYATKRQYEQNATDMNACTLRKIFISKERHPKSPITTNP